MPNRILKESICTSDSVDKLTWFEEVLFYRLIVNCDDYGRFDGRPSIIKSRLFPLKETLTTKTVSGAIKKLENVGLVTLYVFEGRPYLYLPTWDHHQSVRAKRSKFPAPENVQASASICMQMKSNESICMQMKSNASICSRNPIQSESESESESNAGEGARARSTPTKDRFGEFDNVLLSQDEFNKLVELYPTDYQERIDRLSSYIASKGTRYKSHYATIRNWARREEQEAQAAKGSVDFMDIDF